MHVNPPPALIRFLETGIKPADLFLVQEIQYTLLDAIAGFAISDLQDLGAAIYSFLEYPRDLLLQMRDYRINI